jgi:hypothetical protein
VAFAFVSYRTDDEPGSAALIERELSRRFGSDNVFRASRCSYSASVKGTKSNTYAKCKVCYNRTYLHPCIVCRLLHATCVTSSPSSGDREESSPC